MLQVRQRDGSLGELNINEIRLRQARIALILCGTPLPRLLRYTCSRAWCIITDKQRPALIRLLHKIGTHHRRVWLIDKTSSDIR